jgi:hypothetical protein
LTAAEQRSTGSRIPAFSRLKGVEVPLMSNEIADTAACSAEILLALVGLREV